MGYCCSDARVGAELLNELGRSPNRWWGDTLSVCTVEWRTLDLVFKAEGEEEGVSAEIGCWYLFCHNLSCWMGAWRKEFGDTFCLITFIFAETVVENEGRQSLGDCWATFVYHKACHPSLQRSKGWTGVKCTFTAEPQGCAKLVPKLPCLLLSF